MSNRKKIASVAFAGVAVTATTTFMAAGPAAAAPCLVKNGGVCYAGPVKAKNKAGTTTMLVDTTKNTTLTCKKAFASGSISKPFGPRIIGFFKKTVTNWSGCSGPFGFTFKAHLTTSPKIIVSPPGHVSKLSGNKISAKISGLPPFSTCRVTISGISVPAKYNNARHSFSINAGHAATLHVKAVSGLCGGLINVSDQAYFAGTYHVSVPAALTIS